MKEGEESGKKGGEENMRGRRIEEAEGQGREREGEGQGREREGEGEMGGGRKKGGELDEGEWAKELGMQGRTRGMEEGTRLGITYDKLRHLHSCSCSL